MKRVFSVLALSAAVLLVACLATPSTFAMPAKKVKRSAFTGVVLGPDDKPVARAVVTYQSSGGTGPHVVRTDAHGRFLIPNLHSDNYDLRASAKGIFSEWEKNITLYRGETKEVTLRLIYAKSMPAAQSKPQHH